jgi:alkylated DNA nucleotide flippase Atl1
LLKARLYQSGPDRVARLFSRAAAWCEQEGQIAEAVGYALAALKAGDRGVPWQRVINSQGEISLPDEGREIQRRLLEAEGIGFDARGRIDFDRFGWDGPDWEWLDQNDFNPAPLLRRTGKKGAKGKQLSFL